MKIKIKVTVPEIVAYYEVDGDDYDTNAVANADRDLFREGSMGWEDIIGSARRDNVTFEVVDNA